MQQLNKFWLILDQSYKAPTCKHENLEEARKELNRLCYSNPGKTFILLESLEAKTGKVTLENLEVIPKKDSDGQGAKVVIPQEFSMKNPFKKEDVYIQYSGNEELNAES